MYAYTHALAPTSCSRRSFSLRSASAASACVESAYSFVTAHPPLVTGHPFASTSICTRAWSPGKRCCHNNTIDTRSFSSTAAFCFASSCRCARCQRGGLKPGMRKANRYDQPRRRRAKWPQGPTSASSLASSSGEGPLGAEVHPPIDLAPSASSLVR